MASFDRGSSRQAGRRWACRRVPAHQKAALMGARVVLRTQEAPVANGRRSPVSVVDDVVAVAGPAPAAGPATVTVIPHLDGPPLRCGPHRRSSPDVEMLAVALQHMADDAAVTGDASQRLDRDRAAVEELRPAETHEKRAHVGDDMHGVAVDMPGLAEARSAGADKR